MRRGQTWTEPVEWVDVYNDWKIYWTGTLCIGPSERWNPAITETCVRLTYQADLQPQLWAAPGWAAKAVHHVEPQVSTEGVALFDSAHKRLTSNLVFLRRNVAHSDPRSWAAFRARCAWAAA